VVIAVSRVSVYALAVVTPVAMSLAIVVAKFSSSAIAAASSFRVSSRSGAPSTRSETAVAILSVTVFPAVPSTVASPTRRST
jgi:hypothetical protein